MQASPLIFLGGLAHEQALWPVLNRVVDEFAHGVQDALLCKACEELMGHGAAVPPVQACPTGHGAHVQSITYMRAGQTAVAVAPLKTACGAAAAAAAAAAACAAAATAGTNNHEAEAVCGGREGGEGGRLDDASVATCPAGTGEQLVFPGSGWYSFLLQGVHVFVPGRLAYVPGGHCVQRMAPAALYCPAGHETGATTGALLHWYPAGHGAQVLCLA